MGMFVVLSHITFVVANLKFQTGCWTRPSRYLQSFFINPRCPQGTVPAEAASTDVLPDEGTNVPEREALVVVLETSNSKEGEHPLAAELGLVKNLLSQNN